MGQWQTEVLKAFTSTISHVPVFREERNSQEWQSIKSNITWELLTCTSLQEDRTHLSVQRSGWYSSASPWHFQHRQISPLLWKSLKAQYGKGQAGQQQPQSGTGKVTANNTGRNFWFSRLNQTLSCLNSMLCFEQRVNQETSWRPFQRSNSVILQFLQRKG